MQFTFNRSIRFFVFILSTSAAGNALAETLYVSDELEITLRTGPGVKNKITRMLKSGEGLEVIQKQPDGYTEVRTASGNSGWVLQRFLMAEPSARSRLDEVNLREQELSEQQQEIASLREGAVGSETQLLTIKKTNSELKAELKRVKKVAADTLIINEKNQQLAEALALAESKQASLQVENERLGNNTEQAWFLRGAGVILLGMFLGLLVPKLRFKKKRKWGDFSNY
jgi:SH3 domain protein